jgi:hypothetical protein
LYEQSRQEPALCADADTHLNNIALRGVDEVPAHEELESFRVTGNLSCAQLTATTIAQTAMVCNDARIEIR